MGTVLTRQERERKIRYVQDMFREDLGKVRSRFVAETIFGMDISGSVRLTKIAPESIRSKSRLQFKSGDGAVS